MPTLGGRDRKLLAASAETGSAYSEGLIRPFCSDAFARIAELVCASPLTETCCCGTVPGVDAGRRGLREADCRCCCCDAGSALDFGTGSACRSSDGTIAAAAAVGLSVTATAAELSSSACETTVLCRTASATSAGRAPLIASSASSREVVAIRAFTAAAICPGMRSDVRVVKRSATARSTCALSCD